MKNALFAIFCVCLLAGVYSIAGCKKNSVTEGRLTGKWIFTGIQESRVVNGVSTPFTQSFDGGSYLQFNADKTFSTIIDLEFDGTWQLDGSNLALTNNGDSAVSNNFNIRTLSSRELILYTNEPNDSGYVESTWHLKKPGS
ncbi:MAG: lipocalin family protein [Chitinophagaceae bacterium]|nr:lipocalin family protein [Chitinophagaceae bacterium]